MAPSEWLAGWRAVHWACLGAGALAALFLLLHSVTFHRLKRRMADLLLSGIALADLGFVGLEALQQAVRSSYFARYRREDEGERDAHYSTGDFALTLGARFSFFMSFYWIANLSLLMRLGNLEALHVRRSLLLSTLASLVYGCMHAILPTLSGEGGGSISDSGPAYRVTAVLLFIMQATPLLIILANLRAVRRSRLNASTQGRNVIRRLTGYCVCATVFTMPYALVLVFSQELVGVGAVTQTLNYFVPVANALLFGTSLSCCCCCATATDAATTLPKKEEKMRQDDTPSSSIDISAGVLTDGSATPGSTGYTGLLPVEEEVL